jgi:antimicrobial peptide system SdpB family protein
MLIVEGGDQINAILTLLLIPICILDNRVNAWKQAPSTSGKLPALLYDNAKYATYFIAIQMAVLYLNAGVAKAFEVEWYNGTAVYYWFYDQMFGASPWLQKSLGFLFKNSITVSLINWGVIGLEISLFVALFLRQEYKYLLFILGFFFHFAIVMVHGLTSFWLAMTGGIILYLFRLDIGIVENFLLLKSALRSLIHSALSNQAPGSRNIQHVSNINSN